MAAAAVVLAGGRSTRMGTAKAALDWHGSTLLRRTTGLVGRVATPVVAVCAPGQELPSLPADVAVHEDPAEGRGPLQGIAVGLAAARAAGADVAFVCSTDLPFLHPAFVEVVLRAVGGVDVALPYARGHRQPLAAAYRTTLVPLVEELLARDERKPAFLLERCDVAVLDDAALLGDRRLAAFDPTLDSLLNVNTPEDYAEARARPAPEVTVQTLGALRSRQGHTPTCVRAATLAGAAAAAAVTLDRHVVAALNGDRLSRDGEVPLVAGDTVTFMAADAGG